MVKVPLWEQTPDALVSLINTGEFVYSNLITITFNSSSDFVPHQIVIGENSGGGPYSFAPDGSNVLAGTGGQIVRVNTDGSQTVIFPTNSYFGSYSPDGTKIVYVVAGGPNLLINTANADGSGAVTIFTDVANNGVNSLHWGSNNKIIWATYDAGQAVWSMNSDGTGAALLLTGGGAIQRAEWSPDATKFLYVERDGSLCNQIWTALANGSGATKITTWPAAGWLQNASWMTSGGRLLFAATKLTTNTVSGPGLWTINVDGTGLRKILTTVNRYGVEGFSPDFPAIAPNGTWISYQLTPALDSAIAGMWGFKVPVPLKLRENIAVENATNAPIENIYLTDADVDIGLYTGSPVWDSKSVRVDKAGSQLNAHWKRGLDVDQCVVMLAPRLVNDVTGAQFPDKIGDTPWIEAAKSGVFAGVDVQIDRAYFPSWGSYATQKTPTGVLTIFAGRAVEIDCTDTSVVFTIEDYRQLFATMIPPAVFEGQCRWTLFSAGCRLLETNFKTTGTLIAGSTKSSLLTSAIVPLGSGTFALGKVRMTSGLNAGFVRTITSWPGSSNQLLLLNPLPFDVTIGDTFEAFPGCNKTVVTCTLFGNRDNHGGFTTIPTATTAI